MVGCAAYVVAKLQGMELRFSEVEKVRRGRVQGWHDAGACLEQERTRRCLARPAGSLAP
jgi:hypothetical protein